MKILHIQFSNINNLKGGPHTISFENAPLSTAGIFAIIGPTGSGKSTILDVITLALFNQIPRFPKSISKKNIDDLGSVITHYAKEADASIIYEIDGVRYTSKWSISKTKTGNWKDYQMTLSDASGEYLDLKRSEVPSKNEEIIGLKYDQFIKSIILAQGEFARFLKADKNERGLLLENITGTGIYRKIGRKAGEKFKAIRQDVEMQKERLGDLDVMTDEELVELNREIEAAEADKKKLDTATKALIAIKQTKTEILRLTKSIAVKKQDIESVLKRQAAFKPQLERLDVHNKLVPIRKELTLYEQAKRNKIRTQGNLDKYKAELKQADIALTEVISRMASITKKDVEESSFLPIMSEFEQAMVSMDSDLKNKIERGQDLRKRINSMLAELDLDLNDKINPEIAVEKLNAYEQNLLKQLNQAGVNPDSNPSNESAELRKEEQVLSRLHEYESLAVQLSSVVQNGKAEVEKQQELYKTIEAQRPLLEKVNLVIETLENNSKNLLKRREAAIHIASLEERRAELMSGEPCPLCGSLDHPYATSLPREELSSIQKEMEESLANLEQESKVKKSIEDTIVKAETSIKHTEDLIRRLREEREVCKSKVEVFISSHPIFKNISQESIQDRKGMLERIIATKMAAINALEKLKTTKALHQDYLKLSEVTQEYRLLQTKRKEKYSGDNPSEECNQLQNKFNVAFTSKTRLLNSIEIETEDLKRANQLLEQTRIQFEPKRKQYGFKSLGEMEDKFLSETAVNEITSQQTKLNQEQTTIQTEVKSMESDLAKYKNDDAEPDTLLEDLSVKLQEVESKRDTLSKELGELSSKFKRNEEVMKKRMGREKEIEKLNKELDKWSLMNSMIGDMSGNKFANFAQGLTLQNLLVFTNKRLVNLTDRYLLDLPKAGGGGLQIIDRYQGDISRSVTTLSGGETFIISLALSLSLSDMASRNVSLDSLFIDEGFGTLDQETLDIALDTLEKLQTESQKTVGVISHVEALKERINVKIKLEKNSQGYSRIEVEG